ncbi:hypothetical protein N8933_10490 [Pseudomonadales bacterium]|nr:hypothetical protein [Pseudomonadales bacterium]
MELKDYIWTFCGLVGYWIGFSASMAIGIFLSPKLPSGPLIDVLGGLLLFAIVLFGGFALGSNITKLIVSDVIPNYEVSSDLETKLGALFVIFGPVAGAIGLNYLGVI